MHTCIHLTRARAWHVQVLLKDIRGHKLQTIRSAMLTDIRSGAAKARLRQTSAASSGDEAAAAAAAAAPAPPPAEGAYNSFASLFTSPARRQSFGADI